eukprot:941218-Pyramimonas_sp.AAC.1
MGNQAKTAVMLLRKAVLPCTALSLPSARVLPLIPRPCLRAIGVSPGPSLRPWVADIVQANPV